MCILVPIDLTTSSRCAVELAALLARATGLPPVLLHVTDGHPPLELLGQLHDMANPMWDAGLEPRLRTLPGSPADRICEQARVRAARWVVMGAGLDPTGRIQGVTLSVCERCAAPVLAVQAPQAGPPIPRGPVCVRRPASPCAREAAGLLARALSGPAENARPHALAHLPEMGVEVVSLEGRCETPTEPGPVLRVLVTSGHLFEASTSDIQEAGNELGRDVQERRVQRSG